VHVSACLSVRGGPVSPWLSLGSAWLASFVVVSSCESEAVAHGA
jgi:hypothetical protein